MSSDSLLDQCNEFFYEQKLDHFNLPELSSIITPNNITTFRQRYFICGKYKSDENNPIFFYFGNEGDVLLYLNNTGLMWENYQLFNAKMIFAEHRYFGNSIPFHKQELNNAIELYKYLTPNQALKDYVSLISYLNPNNKDALIGFGGSYGGQLCAFFSMKYSLYINGCISASAPILDFKGFVEQFNISANYFSQITTNIVNKLNNNNICSTNIHNSWKYIFKYAKTKKGRHILQKIFNFCDIIPNEKLANATSYWLYDGIATMAMGTYPYKSSYMLPNDEDAVDDATLPPLPLKYGCDKYLNKIIYNPFRLLNNLHKFINIYYNSSGNKQCYNVSGNLNNHVFGYMDPHNAWNWIECSIDFSPGSFDTPSSDGIHDMFWYNEWNQDIAINECINSLNIEPKINYIYNEYNKYIQNNGNGFKNVIFSNGNYDPWSGGGVKFNNTNNNIYSISFGNGGHHQDLMWYNRNDSIDVINARLFEIKQIKLWINKHYNNDNSKYDNENPIQKSDEFYNTQLQFNDTNLFISCFIFLFFMYLLYVLINIACTCGIKQKYRTLKQKLINTKNTLDNHNDFVIMCAVFSILLLIWFLFFALLLFTEEMYLMLTFLS